MEHLVSGVRYIIYLFAIIYNFNVICNWYQLPFISNEHKKTKFATLKTNKGKHIFQFRKGMIKLTEKHFRKF